MFIKDPVVMYTYIYNCISINIRLTFNYVQGKYLDFVDNSILIIKIFNISQNVA